MMDQFAGHVLLLSGHPGSGKTTLAETLARYPGALKAHLHTDDLWGYIKTGIIDPWLPQAHEQNRMVMRIAADMAAAYARHGYVVLLDGVIRPWALPAFTAPGVPVHYVVLRTSAEEAVARCRARGGDSLADPVVVRSLHAEFADLGNHEPFALALSGLDRDQARDAVLAALNSGRHRLA